MTETGWREMSKKVENSAARGVVVTVQVSPIHNASEPLRAIWHLENFSSVNDDDGREVGLDSEVDCGRRPY